jgi:hypothetical protein
MRRAIKCLVSLLVPFMASIVLAVWFEASMIRGAVIGIEEQAAYEEVLGRRAFAAALLTLGLQFVGGLVIQGLGGWRLPSVQALAVEGPGGRPGLLRSYFPAFLLSLTLTALCFFLIVAPSDRSSWFEMLRATLVRWLDGL